MHRAPASEPGYYNLPVGLRRVLISAYRRLRGHPPLKYWEEAEARQWWPRERLAEYQQQQLTEALRHASTHVPYYRERGLGDRLADYPVLTKLGMIEHFESLSTTNTDRRHSFKVATGGSTGEQVVVRVDFPEHASRLGVSWRGDCWGGIKPWDRGIALYGASHLGYESRERLFRPLLYLITNRLTLNCLQMSPQRAREVHAYLRRAKPVAILGYTSTLASFSCHILEQSLGRITCKKVTPTAEQLDARSEQLIRACFDAPLMQRYGCREVGDIAHQCEHGNWHLNADHVYLEVLKADGTISTTGRGRLLITKLHNRWQPLVRYDLGDMVTLGGEPCPCGRCLPTMSELHGRVQSMIYLEDGTTFSPQAPGLPALGKPVVEWQLIQDSATHCRYLVVPKPDFTAKHAEQMKTELAQWLDGKLDVTLEVVDEIAPLPSGKRPCVISALEAQHKAKYQPPAE